jgi:hypothetical protein
MEPLAHMAHHLGRHFARFGQACPLHLSVRMRDPQRHFGHLLPLGAVMVLAGSAAACGGVENSSPGGGDAAPAHDANTDGGPAAPVCPAPGELPPYATAVSGTVTGTSLSGDFCNATAHLYLSTSTTPPDQLLFFLDTSASTTSTFTAPAQASHALLTASLSVSAARPGVYKSSDGDACGSLSFGYALPVPAGVDCEGKTGPDCPSGCSSACSGFGCEPCTAQQPGVEFEALGTSDCLGESQTKMGSWTLTLISVTPYEADGGSGDSYDKVHGTLTATLVEQGDGGSQTAALSASF